MQGSKIAQRFMENVLFTISEIAVALIGFSGVVTVLGHCGQGDWQAAEKSVCRRW